MADVAIQTGGAEDAPLGYQIPGAQEIVLKAITASFDGSGAAGDFVPTLQIIAPNGLVVASCPVGASVAAGASADVSWFPRGGVSGGGGGSSLDTTDGVTDVDPTTQLLIGAGLTLTNPSPGVAELASPGAGSYVFISEASPIGTGLFFNGIPQNGRHLVIELWFVFSSQVPIITFNGSVAAVYKTLYESLQDLNGAITNVQSSTTPTQSGIYLEGMDTEYPSRAVITIPYYRLNVAGGFRDRSLEVESWGQTNDVGSGTVLIRHTKTAGWWNPSPGNPAPAITDIKISIAGALARASLYQIL